MNFIGSMEGSELRVELKYCERCGGLFLRRPAEDQVYCVGCTMYLAQQTGPGGMPSHASLLKLRGRRRTRKAGSGGAELGNAGHIGCLQGVADVGVWA